MRITDKIYKDMDPYWMIAETTLTRLSIHDLRYLLENPEEAVLDAEQKECVISVLEDLDDTERDIIEYRYGLLDGNRHTFKDCETYFSMAECIVRRLCTNGIIKLRFSLRNTLKEKGLF